MLFETIAGLIADRIGCDKDEVKAESRFTELGIDSLDTVELLMELEDVTGKQIELEEKLETVGDLVKYIEKKTKE